MMKCICINFHSEFRFHAGKHDDVEGLISIGIPYVSVSIWGKDAYSLLITAFERTYRHKEFIVKNSDEWYEKLNAAIQEYKESEEKRHKEDIKAAWDTINKNNSRINDLENENIALRKVIKIVGDEERVR